PLFCAVPAPVIAATVVNDDDSGICSINEPMSNNRAEVDEATAECRGSKRIMRRVSVYLTRQAVIKVHNPSTTTIQPVMSHIDPGLKPPAVSVINMTIYIRWPYCTPCPKPFAAAVMARAPREPYPTRCGAVSLKRKVTGAAMSQAVAAAN